MLVNHITSLSGRVKTTLNFLCAFSERQCGFLKSVQSLVWTEVGMNPSFSSLQYLAPLTFPLHEIDLEHFWYSSAHSVCSI